MKRLKLLSLLLAILMLIFALAACTAPQPEEEPDQEEQEPSGDPEAPTGDYDITSLQIDGNDISNYIIVTNRAVVKNLNAANALKNAILEKTGVDVPVVSVAEEGKKIIYVQLVPNAGDTGFRVRVDSGNMYIEGAFQELIESVTKEFVTNEISEKNGTLSFSSSYTYAAPVKVVSYKDYGAVGDGVTDDYAAIKKAHDEANKYGYWVEATPGATYYIGAIGLPSVVIKTNTDWKGANFIIDDHEITSTSHPSAGNPVFCVTPSLSRISIPANAVTSLAAGASSLGYAPGVDCLVYVENSAIKRYIRYGANANNGKAQQEVLLVRADGSIDKNTRPVWDYENITKIWAVPIDETPITVQNGVFKTIANEINPDKYLSVNRGIEVKRSNTTIKGVKHTVEQTKDYRAAYAGFFKLNECNNILVYECEIYAHIASYFKKLKDDGVTYQNVLLGSYELSANHCNNIVWEKCVQTNLFDENGKLYNRGLMATNYCKNAAFKDSTIARFDSHMELYNLTVQGCKIQRVNTIGSGTVKIENTEVYGDFMVDLRSDYGGIFNGDFYIKNVTFKNPNKLQRLDIFSGDWANHDFGYTVVQPQNIYITNLVVEGNDDAVVYLYEKTLDNKPDLTAATVNGKENKNPIVPTKLVEFKSNPAKTRFCVNPGPTYENVQVIYPAGEEPAKPVVPQPEDPYQGYIINEGFNSNINVNEDGFVTTTTAKPAGNGEGSMQIYNSGNGHDKLNIRLTQHNGSQALLFSGRGNPNGVTKHTNICVDIRPGSSNKDKEAYELYKGRNLVIAYDITPIAQSSDVNASENVAMCQLSNFYDNSSESHIMTSTVCMRLSDFSLYIPADGTRPEQELNVRLEGGVTYTFALHLKIQQNAFDVYLNDTLIASDITLIQQKFIDRICTYDESGALVTSTKANKMEDLMISYARLAMIRGWAITGDVYIFDNARLYYSETYLGTGSTLVYPQNPEN